MQVCVYQLKKSTVQCKSILFIKHFLCYHAEVIFESLREKTDVSSRVLLVYSSIAIEIFGRGYKYRGSAKEIGFEWGIGIHQCMIQFGCMQMILIHYMITSFLIDLSRKIHA